MSGGSAEPRQLPLASAGARWLIAASETVRKTVATVAALATDKGVMARAVPDKLELDKSNASRRLRWLPTVATSAILRTSGASPGRWVVGDPLPESVDLLPDPAQLATADTMPDQSGCAVALGSEEENSTQFDGAASTNGHRDPGIPRCRCGNRLITPEARNSGLCKPCRDRSRIEAEAAS